MDETVRNLARDLARRYKLHGPRIEQIWRSLGQEQQEQVVREGCRNGEVLRDPFDTSLGNVYKIMPEWNIRDLTRTSPDFFLDILKHRATNPLQTQYSSGANDHPGDHAHIVNMMQTRGLELIDAPIYVNCYTLFTNEEKYGQSIKVKHGKESEVLPGLMPAIQAQLIVPQATGDLILMRQQYLLQSLIIIIEDILETAISLEDQTKHGKKSDEVAIKAMAMLSVHSTTEVTGLPQLLVSSLECSLALEDYTNLLTTEPTVLASEVNFWFFTRPELVPDEKGQRLPVHTDRYISEAVFDAVYATVKSAAVWAYVSKLLGLLDTLAGKHIRPIILQELSNVCHLEYTRAQTMFRRTVSAGSGGSKWFKRMSAARKDGLVRISVKRDPESLTRQDPQLHYMLRLCQDETTYSRAAEWIQKIEDLHRAHPLEKHRMTERELDALGDLAVIVTFIQSLSSVVQLPAGNHKKGQLFMSEYLALGHELAQLRPGIDLGDFAIPIDNLLQPDMATGALARLDEYFLDKTGTRMGLLYQDLVNDSTTKIRGLLEQRKAESGKLQAEYVVPAAPEAQETIIRRRREKEKTRPAHSSFYDIRPQTVGVTETVSKQAPPIPEVFKVKSSTFTVFSSMLSRSSAARGSVSWDAFTGAMTDLGFSVVPKAGSIYTFIPPEKMEVQRNLTLHRPHQSNIEGPRLLVFSRRLTRVYGWDESSFVEI